MRGPIVARGGGRMMHTSKPKNTKATIGRMFKYLRPYAWQFTVVMVMVVVAAVANILGTYMLQPIVDNAIENADKALLVKMVVSMAMIYIVGTLCSFAYQLIMVKVSAGTLKTLRSKVFNHMETLPISYFDQRTHGEIMSTYSNDIDSMREMIARSLPQLLNSLTTIIGYFVAMVLLNWMLIFVCLIQVGVNLVIITFVGKKSKKNFKDRQRDLALVNGQVEECVEGQKVIKVFNYEQQAEQRFEVLNESLRVSAGKAQATATVLMPIMGNVAHIFYAIVVAVGAMMVFNTVDGVFHLGGLSVAFSIGGLVTFLEYSRRFSMPITNLSQQFNSIFHALAGAERVFALLDQQSERDEGSVTLVHTQTVDGKLVESDKHTGAWAWKKVTGQHCEYIQLFGDIVFNNVTFGYKSDKTVLHNVSLCAHTGQKIALVGSTGAGKTTITNLITRFYDIQGGSITYDGIDIRDIKKNDLRRSLAMVLQDTHLFTGTVMENIRYGRLDATDEDCIAAAKLANAHFFISHMPNGYQTMLTADGENLSQGQRQLLNIARAAVADAPLLILDEATSSIDTRTESLIEKGIDRLTEGRTTFVIAHRLSTVRNADLIIVLEHGEVIEKGNHQSLLQQQGKYYQLHCGMLELD